VCGSKTSFSSDYDHPMTTQTSDRAPDKAGEWAARFSDRMSRVRASEIRELLKLLDQPDILSFAGGIPDPGLFPAEQIQAGYDAILADQVLSRQALQYSVSEGYLPLRQWIAERMTRDGMPCEPHNIMLTAGSQQALDLIGKLFISPGDTVVVARPTYLGALQAFNGYEPAYGDLPEDALKDPATADLPHGALGYFVPDFANPTGVSLTLEERQAVLALAERLDWPLVEDAAYRELRFIGEPTPTLLSLDIARSGGIDNARTLFLGTLSKTLSPALRIGWVCGPKAVIEKLVLLKQGADLHVSTINQMVAHRAVSEGYDQHLHRLRGAYGHKARVMLTALERTMPKGVTWSRPEGGMFVWIDLPEGIDGAGLLARAIAEERVAFVPGAPFFAEVQKANAIRLSYSLPTDAQIEEGVARLARLIGRVIAEG
jgi:DNA-binding transcriptional MocR family regulator